MTIFSPSSPFPPFTVLLLLLFFLFFSSLSLVFGVPLTLLASRELTPVGCLNPQTAVDFKNNIARADCQIDGPLSFRKREDLNVEQNVASHSWNGLNYNNATPVDLGDCGVGCTCFVWQLYQQIEDRDANTTQISFQVQQRCSCPVSEIAFENNFTTNPMLSPADGSTVNFGGAVFSVTYLKKTSPGFVAPERVIFRCQSGCTASSNCSVITATYLISGVDIYWAGSVFGQIKCSSGELYARKRDVEQVQVKDEPFRYRASTLCANAFVRKTRQPTPQPTPIPPTAQPTARPTPVPTTATPTAVPTPIPPTAQPTPLPPTAEPTPRPTPVPTTPFPTAFPTERPSAVPTTEPTPRPSAVPTRPPCFSCVALDHCYNAFGNGNCNETTCACECTAPYYGERCSECAPNCPPTPSPSTSPTRSPTVRPSARPTALPTPIPPTAQPTPLPPTAQPTARPTAVPTTATPTSRPTPQPPTRSPTPQPTSKPTTRPTTQPTLQPTPQPTFYIPDGGNSKSMCCLYRLGNTTEPIDARRAAPPPLVVLPTVTYSVCACFGNITGKASSVISCGTDCGIPELCSSANIPCRATDSVSSQSQFRWGLPEVDPMTRLRKEQSGVGFSGRSGTNVTAAVSRDFVLGDFVHYNFPIVDRPATGFTMHVVITMDISYCDVTARRKKRIIDGVVSSDEVESEYDWNAVADSAQAGAGAGMTSAAMATTTTTASPMSATTTQMCTGKYLSTTIKQRFSYPLVLDETNNNCDTLGGCCYPNNSPGSPPCSDKVEFGLGRGIDMARTFVLGNKTFTLQLSNFRNAANNKTLRYFITDENQANTATLYGRVFAGCPIVCNLNNTKQPAQPVITKKPDGSVDCSCECINLDPCKVGFALDNTCECKPESYFDGYILAPIPPGTNRRPPKRCESYTTCDNCTGDPACGVCRSTGTCVAVGFGNCVNDTNYPDPYTGKCVDGKPVCLYTADRCPPTCEGTCQDVEGFVNCFGGTKKCVCPPGKRGEDCNVDDPYKYFGVLGERDFFLSVAGTAVIVILVIIFVVCLICTSLAAAARYRARNVDKETVISNNPLFIAENGERFNPLYDDSQRHAAAGTIRSEGRSSRRKSRSITPDNKRRSTSEKRSLRKTRDPGGDFEMVGLPMALPGSPNISNPYLSAQPQRGGTLSSSTLSTSKSKFGTLSTSPASSPYNSFGAQDFKGANPATPAAIQRPGTRALPEMPRREGSAASLKPAPPTRPPPSAPGTGGASGASGAPRPPPRAPPR